MHRAIFRRKVRALYPGRRIRFEHSPVMNAATMIEGTATFIFYNSPHSETVSIQWNGKSAGTAPAIENA
jgi:hypothetical protein